MTTINMGNIPSKTKEPKASIIHGLIEKRPAQDVIVTAIQQLYSRQQIMGFIQEYAVMRSNSKGGRRQGNLAGTEAVINRAFEKFKDSEEFSGPIKEKWTAAIMELDTSSSRKLSDLLRGGRRTSTADLGFGLSLAAV
jgi:hypothetical protein